MYLHNIIELRELFTKEHIFNEVATLQVQFHYSVKLHLLLNESRNLSVKTLKIVKEHISLKILKIVWTIEY